MDTVTINRAPVLTLWAAVVAERLGFDRDEALTLGKAVAGLTAQSKGQRLGIFTPSPEAVRRQRAEKAKKAGVQEGDILMLCAAHNKEYIGRCDLVRDLAANIPGGKVCSVAELIIIRPNPKIILPEFLLTYVRMPMVLEEIIRMVKGQTAHLYPSDLRELEVVVPSLDVQRKIADAWTKAEADYIRRTREAQEDLERARKAAEAAIMAVEDSVQTNGTGAMPLFKGLHTRPG